METTLKTPQFYRTRKALLLLPLLVLPLITLAYWNFHPTPAGGQTAPNASQGLNTSLPGAKFDKHAKPGNKMSFYDQAKQDSARAQSNNNNPLLKQFGFNKDQPVSNDLGATHRSPLMPDNTDPNVTRINQKLAAINQEISQPQTSAVVPVTAANKPANDKTFTEQVNKLQTMMQAMNSSQGNDPQMQQLSKMLAQIQEIQHPEAVKKDSAKAPENPFRTVPAIIDGNQKVLQGSAVRLKLDDSIRIKSLVIPKGTLAYGTAMITNQRLLIEIKNIRLDNNIIPIALTVYDKDGMQGVPAPEAELAGSAGEGANNAVENMQLMSMDASLGAQAAAGGITAAKNLFSKKVRRIRIKLKNGYPVLLRNNKL